MDEIHKAAIAGGEEITILSTVREMAQAYIILDNAKADCKTVVDSALEAYLELTPDATKEDGKAIIKLAKAFAKGKQRSVAADADKIAEICTKLGIECNEMNEKE